MSTIETLGKLPKVYEPFPPGKVPEGWPKEYVALADYKSLQVGKIYARTAMFLRSHRGSATDGDITFDLSTCTDGSPLVHSKQSKRIFHLSWMDIITLAVQAGINDD